MEYLTDQDYEIASSNGISRENAYQRFYSYGWSKRRAITTPVNKIKKSWEQWGTIAESNGIKKDTFKKRMSKGWASEKAATYPVHTKRKKEQSDECPAL